MPGRFLLVIEVPLERRLAIERALQGEFKPFHVQYPGGGEEFYKKEVIDKIIPFLERTSVSFRVLSSTEIESMQKKRYAYRKLKTLLLSSSFKTIKMPRPDQFEIIAKSIAHFRRESKGVLILPCGTGKTLNALWIIQKMKWRKILIGVPNCTLLLQWKQAFQSMEFFGDYKIMTIQEGIKMNEIQSFCAQDKPFIVITTYQSCHKLLNFKFDAKICDEMHHLTTKDVSQSMKEERKSHVKFLNIDSKFQLGLTATPRVLQDCERSTNAIANDSTDNFGDIIEKAICDYRIERISFATV